MKQLEKSVQEQQEIPILGFTIAMGSQDELTGEWQGKVFPRKQRCMFLDPHILCIPILFTAVL